MCLALVVWLDVETFSLTCVRNSTNCSLCNIRAATEYRAPEHVGRVMTCPRTKNVAARCVMFAIFHWIVTQFGDDGHFQDWIEADTDVHVAVISSVAVTFGACEPGCASTIRFESAPQDYAGHNMTKR